MWHLTFVILLSFRVGFLDCQQNLDGRSASSQNAGSHNLLVNSANRSTRCTPCVPDNGVYDRRPVPNHLNPEYRGNGADNLGYDWTPKAWGGLAFPQKSKTLMAMMRGRGGRTMGKNWAQNPENVRIVCDNCRAYWDGNPSAGGGRIEGEVRQYPSPGVYNRYGGLPGYWQGGRATNSHEYEARVTSPAVGVLIKPGSRIAYIPSRSGEMYWDGVSGGGTRWDGFSNGISWVVGGAPDWNYVQGREDKPGGYGMVSQAPGNDIYSSSPPRPWDNQKGISGWDNSGKGYYFANGFPNRIDPQRRDRGYASNWHYGSTDQNGWNGNNMKWNYGSKNWDDNDRAGNRFYFNSPHDRGYRPGGGKYPSQYGIHYPNYEYGSHIGYRPNQGNRLNDRDPSSFPSQGNQDRPWDYNSINRYGDRKPGVRPDWRPSPDSFNKDPPGKYPVSNKNDYERPRGGRPGYGPSKPDPGNNFPYGGNNYPGNGGHLFYPNDHHPHNNYPAGSEYVGSRPDYQNLGNRPGHHQTGSYPSGGGGGGGGGGSSHPSGGSSSITYTGGRPPAGNLGGYPTGYPPSFGRYPTGGGSSYPGSNTRPGGYPGSSGEYPGSGSYSGGNRPGQGYSGSGGSFPNGYNAGGSGRYPSGNDQGFPGGYSYPGDRPGYSPSGSSIYNAGGYIGGRPDKYPSGYPNFGRPPPSYLSGGQPAYPGSASGGSYGGGPSPGQGFYTGIITEIGPDGGHVYYGGSQTNHYGGSYPGDKNTYPGINKDRYPYGGENSNKYPNDGKDRFGDDRYSTGDRFYYGQDMSGGKYPDGYTGNGSGSNGYDHNQGSGQDKNSWNYGDNDHRDGIFRRSGGSYPPYRGGPYYTSSYLASKATTSGSIQEGSETQSVTKPDDATQPTPESS